ncbi:aminotransferase class V-fold PLP-dependent enzyme [Candidatus Neptunochlamydia vexilliferae]|uniref:Aminotransferase class V domain-containing protein n=1 Tax=Candidatus Neptunichlamydia vexilliferae TaxID=1651774 RepID=A0ABS0AZ42_9BACT|nr:aminotransferase class V-fold PLP-dependent enzyme [Candidatus Neptunochlamydia vexilliferae]MBF5058600.1 hypothetical protein [Candidatus Neptunochlamydia vexilliferae]
MTPSNYYPVLKEGIFLNHAATAPVSYRTIERMQALCGEMKEPLGKHFYEALGVMEQTRRLLADLLGCHPGELAFTPNTSSSLSLVAQCLDFKAGDRVLIPRDEFPSNRYVWQNIKRVECSFFDIPHDVSLTEVLERENLEGVRLISVSLVSYLTGKKHDMQAFGEFCKKRGIISCVDAIQGVGTFPINLKESPVDFFVGAAQKWLLGPIGCGYFYIRKELIDKVHVPFVGWTSVRYPENFERMPLEFADEATRFEAGLPNIVSIGGLHASLTELQEFGWDHIYGQIEKNTRYLAERLDPLVPYEELGAIVTFKLPEKVHPKKLAAKLAAKKITVTARSDYVRVSPHFYNTEEELETFVKTIGAELKNHHLFFPEKSPRDREGRILLVGATGTLGKEIALYLMEKGFQVMGIGRNRSVLDELSKQEAFEETSLELTDRQAIKTFLRETPHTYSGLINCAGMVDVEPVTSLDDEKLVEMFAVNTLAPTLFMQWFASQPGPLGVLNIVSPLGQGGYPLLGGYGSTYAALEILTQALEREKKDLHVTTYFSSPMHSPMQKDIGRAALRYFKMEGTFNYRHAEEVAREAVDAFLAKKRRVMSFKNRLQFFLNRFAPKFVTRKIEKVWLP